MEAWELYQMCRQLQLIIFEKPTGKKDGSKILTTVLWPTGFSVLPDGVGVMNEKFILMHYFNGFRSGEMEAASKIIAKRGK